MEHLKRAAELLKEEIRRAAELHDIELFKQPSIPEEECPICFLRLSNLTSGWRYQTCCGKIICCGCIHAMDKICPFCRTPTPKSDGKYIEQIMKRVDAGDAQGIASLGFYYNNGMYGLPQDHAKALKHWRRAAELGYVAADFNISCNYANGHEVEMDMKKAMYYWELAAMGGHTAARHNLGAFENNAGNMDRALRHYMISVDGGCHLSLREIQKLYKGGLATKDDYTTALLAYQKYLNEVKSPQRDEAAAASEDYKYIE